MGVYSGMSLDNMKNQLWFSEKKIGDGCLNLAMEI